ncbi:UDP-glycosyltransferase UGT5-like isoform X2 [Penaeus japonicus]|nr:UDP-glycosyltransferase UGT5-like isoform X2 [Penaeus japonicus]XP_042894392.1 UDP-glycosyltransferase UGT5-like isoform X2 [Penaeus japonicus]XP_042894393.1 UDP-glycosyltransferase UGT5-like isoform X2 [Penaeus japonicus]
MAKSKILLPILLLTVAMPCCSASRAMPVNLEPPRASYNILMLLPLSSRSHRNIFLTLARSLADRGHKVELLVNHEPVSENPSIREVYHGLDHFKEEKFQLFTTRERPWEVYRLLREGLPAMTRDLYQVPAVRDLYRRRTTFDVVIIDNYFNQMVYPFALNLPFISLSASGIDHTQSSLLGNVLNPAYVSAIPIEFRQPLGFLQRVLNLAVHVLSGVMRHHVILPSVQQEVSALFPEVPPLREIERNQSLVLYNSHFSMSHVLPLLPSQVEIGTMHCHPGSPLPQELSEWVEGAGSAGVVYFSLGTVALGKTMPERWRDLFLQAFRMLPQRVVWKYEGDLSGVPDNVLIRKWLPQQDLLAHPNVRVFMTHGGMLSTQEATYHATPMLLLPIFADQPRNAHAAHEKELGVMLDWDELSVPLIVRTVTRLVTDGRYKANVQAVSSALKDQPQSPLERAVFWTEYVIRHQGAPRLRSLATDLSWVEYLMLDVLLLFHGLAVFAYFLIRWACGYLCQRVVLQGATRRKCD